MNKVLFSVALLASLSTINAMKRMNQQNQLTQSLIQAAYNGEIETVKSLVSRGADINGATHDGRTALMMVCEWVFRTYSYTSAANEEIARYLLSKGAVASENALMIATAMGNTKMVKLLLDHQESSTNSTQDEKDCTKSNREKSSSNANSAQSSSSTTSSSNNDKKDNAKLLLRAYFSPHIRDVLKMLFLNEQEEILGAQFVFTLYDLAKVWVEKKSSGIDGALVVDYEEAISQHPEALKLLIQNGIPVVASAKSARDTHELMHHKFFIFEKNVNDKPLVITGSFNCTGKANENNWENIMLIDDEPTINRFKEEFAHLLQDALRIKLKTLENSSYSCGVKTDYLNGYNPFSGDVAHYKGSFVSAKDFHILLEEDDGTAMKPYFNWLRSKEFIGENKIIGSITNILCNLLSKEKEEFKGALYLLNEPDIVNAFINRRKKKKITGLLILNNNEQDLERSFSGLKKLNAHSCKLRVNSKKHEFEAMHHKFIVFHNINGGKLLVTSSAHPNSNANPRSWENTIITDDSVSIAHFEQEFKKLKENSSEIPFEAATTATKK